MNKMNNKELKEQMELIRVDAVAIEVSDKVSPENMMKYIEKREREEYTQHIAENAEECTKQEITEGNKTKGEKKVKKINKWLAGGIVAGLIAATLAIIINITGPGTSIYTVDDYYNMVKADTESEDELASLSGYEQLHKYLVVEDTVEVEYGFFEKIGMFFERFFDEGFSFIGSDKSASDGPVSYDDYSKTNNRTENIDESDVVKTDGEYVYFISREGSSGYEEQYLNIAKADGDKTEILSVIPLNKYVDEEYVEDEEYYLYYEVELMISGNRLVAICDCYDYIVLLVWDITQKENPKYINKLYVEGTYFSSKLVDEYLYVFASKSVDRYIYLNREQQTEAEAKEFLAIKTSNGVLDTKDVYVSDSSSYTDYMIIATVDMNDTKEFKQIKAILGNGYSSTVYMSPNHIYYISTMRESMEEIMPLKDAEDEAVISSTTSSQIISLSYDEGVITPKAKNVIEGYIGDEFDIDEYNGNVRLAVSVSQSKYGYEQGERVYYNGVEWIEEKCWVYDEDDDAEWSDESWSALYVLDENLQVIGSIPKLMLEEEVYGVRFDGDIGYVVTYRQTDPLFTIDLSDPAHPIVIGKLKIPGFSQYLFQWDENTLIGIGENDNGTLKISTFDVTDKTNVIEKDICNLKGDGSLAVDSEAMYNHKAIMICPEKNLIGLPYNDGQGYYVLSYVDGNLEKVIRQYFANKDTDARARGMYIGSYIYIVSEYSGIFIYDLNTYNLVKSVELQVD